MPIKIIINICLLRANPQDLPASMALTLAILAVYFFANVLSVLDSVPVWSALLSAGADALLLAAATQLALRWRHFESRMLQTLTALAGAGAVLVLLVWAAMLLLQAALAPGWLWMVFLLWYLSVYSHVLRHALSLPLAASVALTVAYMVLSIFVTTGFLYPVAPEG